MPDQFLWKPSNRTVVFGIFPASGVRVLRMQNKPSLATQLMLQFNSYILHVEPTRAPLYQTVRDYQISDVSSAPSAMCFEWYCSRHNVRSPNIFNIKWYFRRRHMKRPEESLTRRPEAVAKGFPSDLAQLIFFRILPTPETGLAEETKKQIGTANWCTE